MGLSISVLVSSFLDFRADCPFELLDAQRGYPYPMKLQDCVLYSYLLLCIERYIIAFLSVMDGVLVDS